MVHHHVDSSKLEWASAPPAGPDLMENQNSHWLTAKEAAGYLKVEPRTVLLWARQGKLKGFALSGTKRHVWRFQHIDLDAMLTSPSVATNGRIQ